MSKQKTIKQLEAEIETLRQLRDCDKAAIKNLTIEKEGLFKRLGHVGAENESLIKDKTWFKIVIESLIQGLQNAKS